MTIQYLLLVGSGGGSTTPGSSGVALTLPANLTIVESGSPFASGGIAVRSNGTVQATGGVESNWMTPVQLTKTQNYECKLDLTSGSPPEAGAILGTWYPLTNTIAWNWLVNAPLTSKTFTGTLSIRRIAVPADIDTSAVSVTLTQG